MRSSITPSRVVYSALIVLILAVDLAITWVDPAADPPTGYSLDHSLSIDGYWYLAEAKARALGEEASVSRSYRKPGITEPASWFYRWAGVSLPSSRILSSVASIAVIALLAACVRRRHGAWAALGAAAWLAVDPAWHTFVRSPVVYPWVALWVLVILTLAGGRPAWRWWSAVALTAAVFFFIKSIVIVVVPTLLLDGWARLRRTSWGRSGKVWALPVALFFLGGGLASVFWKDLRLGRFVGYLTEGDHSGLTAWAHFEERSQWLGAQPFAVLLAALGVFLFARRWVPCGGERRFDRLVHGAIWLGVVPFVIAGYSPLRYLTVLTPLLVYAAVGAIVTMSHRGWGRARGDASRSLRILSAVPAVGVIALALQSAWSSALPWTSVLIAATFTAVAIAYVARGRHAARPAGRPDHRCAWQLGWIALVVLGAAPRLLDQWERRDHSLARAQSEIASILLPSAKLLGPYAHALTVENTLEAEQITRLAFGDGKLRRELERRGATHLVSHVDDEGPLRAVFSRAGLPLEPVERFHVRGRRVDLYRIPLGTHPRSAFEEAVRALEQDEEGAAVAILIELVRRQPSAAAWGRLGRAWARVGRVESAQKCYEEALRLDPGRLDAHLGLVEVFGNRGETEKALEHLERATEIEPLNEHLRERSRALRSLHGVGQGD